MLMKNEDLWALCLLFLLFFSGTTWFQEIVWLLTNDADVKTAKEVLQDIRVPYLEIDKGKVWNAFPDCRLLIRRDYIWRYFF